jgi:hypothetical protein
MRFRNRQPAEDPAPEEDPLSPYAAPTVRRPLDRGSTQPLDDTTAPARGSGMQVDGTDFANRQTQRRQRQGGARVYTARVGELARGLDNRQLLMLGAAVVLALIALLWWQAARRDDNLPNVETRDQVGATTPALEANSGVAAPAGEIITAQPGAVIATMPPAEAPSAAPPAAQAFVVSGTGEQGLFLRAGPSTQEATMATLPEGTRVEALGEEQSDGTRTWRKVRTPQGEGWVAADFIIPEP